MSTYKEMQSQLDVIIAELQDGSLNIDEAVKKFEEANKLIIKMEKHLKEVENKIQKIKINLSN